MSKKPEVFCTLFDWGYLPQGLALYQSLMSHAFPFELWVLCMGHEVEFALRELGLPNVKTISLHEIESPELINAKRSRSWGEYCWTLTPFLPGWVMERLPMAERVTYLDADLFFFSDPRPVFEELEVSGKDVLITPHDYDSSCDQSISSGIYCVQFMPFRNTSGGWKVLKWWQERCLEWCYARTEDGRFGDQKYLDDWPERFTSETHVHLQRHLAIAPWNLKKNRQFLRDSKPVFFHFHSLRIGQNWKIQEVNADYTIPESARWLFEEYRSVLKISCDLMATKRIPLRVGWGRCSYKQRLREALFRFKSRLGRLV